MSGCRAKQKINNSTAIPPPLSSDVMDQHNRIGGITFGSTFRDISFIFSWSLGVEVLRKTILAEKPGTVSKTFLQDKDKYIPTDLATCNLINNISSHFV